MAELKVKEILNQRGISVPEFAQMVGVTREYCYSLVSGKHASQKNIEKMARILNLPIRDLYAVPTPISSEPLSVHAANAIMAIKEKSIFFIIKIINL